MKETLLGISTPEENNDKFVQDWAINAFPYMNKDPPSYFKRHVGMLELR